jgi:hypothetical protein
VFKHEREGSSEGSLARQVWLLHLHHAPLVTKMKHPCFAVAPKFRMAHVTNSSYADAVH